MNVSVISKLNIRCYRCGIIYYSTVHLNNNSCRLCNIPLIEDPVEMIQYSKLNDAIEIVLPRHLYTLDLGPLEKQRIKNFSGIPVIDSVVWVHITNRLAHRIQHGSWKSRHRRIRTNVLSKMMSKYLPEYLIMCVFQYITWEEMSVIFNYYVKQLNL